VFSPDVDPNAYRVALRSKLYISVSPFLSWCGKWQVYLRSYILFPDYPSCNLSFFLVVTIKSTIVGDVTLCSLIVH
jgi:hypothetical protein